MEVIVGETVEAYLHTLLPPREPVFQKMETEAQKRGIPIVGPLVGRLLHQLALIHGGRRVYEMGSAIGYSTLWWARAVGRQGEVYYTDGNPKNADEARGYLREAGAEEIAKIHVGNALEIIDSLPGEFDIIFCDIDKGDYPRAFKKALPRLRKGGLLIADNVLWGGSVATSRPSDRHGGVPWQNAMKEFNKLLYETPGLFTTIIPLRDGVSVSLKS